MKSNQIILSDEEVVEKLLSGMSVKKINQAYGGSCERMNRIRKANGIPACRPGGPRGPRCKRLPNQGVSRQHAKGILDDLGIDSGDAYTTTPPKVPGWYWVQALRMWPKVIPFSFVGGGIGPANHEDRLTQWRWFSGPIAEPALKLSTVRAKGE